MIVIDNKILGNVNEFWNFIKVKDIVTFTPKSQKILSIPQRMCLTHPGKKFLHWVLWQAPAACTHRAVVALSQVYRWNTAFHVEVTFIHFYYF